jgi:hypothetical protein
LTYEIDDSGPEAAESLKIKICLISDGSVKIKKIKGENLEWLEVELNKL